MSLQTSQTGAATMRDAGTARSWVALGTGLAVVLIGSLNASLGQPPATTAKVDTQALQLASPDRYQISTILEPIRRVTLVAAADGIVRSQDAREGADVRANQDVAQLDKTEALALLKIAQAEAKEWKRTAELLKSGQEAGKASQRELVQAESRAEVAQARVDLAQAALDRCTLRAPFAGRVIESFVSDGQYVTKGTVIAELADVSSLRAIVPLPRTGTTVGGVVTVTIEGKPVQGKVQSILPLSESLSVLRELFTPLGSAWVVVPNTGGALEPGQRVLSPALPTLPLAVVPSQALLKADAKSDQSIVQVIRNEYVVNVPVRVLGQPGPDRMQVSGALRPSDALITSTSVPLLPGTLIRFNGGSEAGRGAVEGTTPNPGLVGDPAVVTPPESARAGARNRPTGKNAPTAGTPTTTAPTPKPETKPAGNTVPF
ncbi:MAG: efflux RND transporter periplasmic adaptor subunit [Isosphaeraceae bacterium]